jgi:hypothetical protein
VLLLVMKTVLKTLGTPAGVQFAALVQLPPERLFQTLAAAWTLGGRGDDQHGKAEVSQETFHHDKWKNSSLLMSGTTRRLWYQRSLDSPSRGAYDRADSTVQPRCRNGPIQVGHLWTMRQVGRLLP